MKYQVTQTSTYIWEIEAPNAEAAIAQALELDPHDEKLGQYQAEPLQETTPDGKDPR